MDLRREVVEGTQGQGVNESVSYVIPSDPWGNAPTILGITARDVTLGGVDVSSTVLSGTWSVAGNVMTLQPVSALTANHLYRIDVQFQTDDGNVFGCYLHIAAQD